RIGRLSATYPRSRAQTIRHSRGTARRSLAAIKHFALRAETQSTSARKCVRSAAFVSLIKAGPERAEPRRAYSRFVWADWEFTASILAAGGTSCWGSFIFFFVGR